MLVRSPFLYIFLYFFYILLYILKSIGLYRNSSFNILQRYKNQIINYIDTFVICVRFNIERFYFFYNFYVSFTSKL